MDLKEWAVEYFKHKDIFTKNIVSIDDSKDVVVIEYKDKKQTVFIRPELEGLSQITEKIDSESYIVVVLNTQDNLDALIKNWNRINKYPRLTFYFVNPDSKTDIKWIVCPFTHSKVADEKTLSLGLNAMFSTVDSA